MKPDRSTSTTLDFRLEISRPFIKKHLDSARRMPFLLSRRDSPLPTCSPDQICEFCLRTCHLLWALILAIALTFSQVSLALAQRGTPYSLEFGMGARLEPTAARMGKSLRLAAQLPLDWVQIPFHWASDWPEAGAWNVNSPFAQAMAQAEILNLTVMVSVVDAPVWAQTAQGPNPALTAALVADLTATYQQVRAVELFPGANTPGGWGASPNPVAYAALMQAVQARLPTDPPVYLVAGGLLESVEAGALPGAEFVRGLYQAGARPAIISLQVVSAEGAVSSATLRPLEDIRAVMLEQGHSDGLVWLTRLSLPPTLQNAALDAQSAWMREAQMLFRAQLYVGVVFFDMLSAPDATGLLGADGRILLTTEVFDMGQSFASGVVKGLSQLWKR